MRVLIVGGGEVGFALAQALAPRHDVIVIDQRPETAARFEALDVEFIAGGGSAADTLQRAGIERADVFVGCTRLDEVNVVACTMANQFGSPQTICFVSREDFLTPSGQQGLARFGSKPANLRLFERVGVDVAISARGAAVASALHEIEGGSSSLLAVLEQGEGRILELEVPANYPARALRDLEPPRDGIIGAILRGNGAIVPRGDDRLHPGDKILVFSTRAAADRVRDFFRASP